MSLYNINHNNLHFIKFHNQLKGYITTIQISNNTLEKIIDLENKKEIFVIRPSNPLEIHRLEKDEIKLQKVYDLGVNDCNTILDSLKKYLDN